MSDLDINGNPTVYSTKETIGSRFAKEQYPAVDPKMTDQLTPHQIEALQALRAHRGRALAQGHGLGRGTTLYIPTTTARALERRGLVDIHKEQAAFAIEEVVTMSQSGNDWLDKATGRKRKKPSKRQRQQAIDDLVDVLRSGQT